MKEFVTLAKPFIEKHAEEEDKPMLLDALDDLSALAPEIVNAAKELSKNPRDPRKRKELGDLVDAGKKDIQLFRLSFIFVDIQYALISLLRRLSNLLPK